MKPSRKSCGNKFQQAKLAEICELNAVYFVEAMNVLSEELLIRIILQSNLIMYSSNGTCSMFDRRSGSHPFTPSCTIFTPTCTHTSPKSFHRSDWSGFHSMGTVS
jgi:hypothetical protein